MSAEEATAQLTGNTKPVNCFDGKKKRNFQLTLNYEQNPDINQARVELLKKYHLVLNYLVSLKFQYIISCIELNTNGYYHIHIFIQFNTPHRLSINKLEGAHVEICRGSVNQNIDYIKKEGTILDELGNAKFILGNPTIKDVIKSKMSDILENIDFRYYRVCKEIKKDYQPTFNTPKNVYIIKDLNDLHISLLSNDYQFLCVQNGKIRILPSNLILKNNQLITKNLNFIFNKFNEPNNKHYPADINNIIIEYKEKYNIKYYLGEYDKLITKIIDLDNNNENEGELDSDYSESEYEE